MSARTLPNSTDMLLPVSCLTHRGFLEEIPLNGRSFHTLIQLTPGGLVSATVFDDQGQFSVNGQGANANYFAAEGVSANFGGSAPPPDSVLLQFGFSSPKVTRDATTVF
jgi:hypothetical protein